MVWRLMHTSRLIGSLLLLGIALGGCVSQSPPPPVQDVGSGAPVKRIPVDQHPDTEASRNGPDQDQDQDQDDRGLASAPRYSSAATNSLIASAEQAMQNLDHSTAIVLLERAVRIAPRDAKLWIRLSDSHLLAGSTNAAEQHARKAIALAGDNPLLNRQAWLQLAKVLDTAGQTSDARSIRSRYGSASG